MPERGARRLTQEEINERKEWLRKWQEERDNDPDFIARRDWIKETFSSDVDAISGFAARMMMKEDSLLKENEQLVLRLNNIYGVARGLSPVAEIPSHVKRNIATMSLEHDPEHPASLAFLSGMKVSKQLDARASAAKRHAPGVLARKFVKAEWAIHRVAYQGNKSAFARDYVRRVKNEFDLKITEKQLREVWLKDAPPAGKPDGLPANGR